MQKEQNNEEVTKVTKPNRHLPLDEWLERVNATTLWSKSIREDLCVECYRIGDGIAIVQRYDRGGWDIFTSGNMIMIPTTLRDAERRLGINPSELPDEIKIDVDDTNPATLVSVDLSDHTVMARRRAMVTPEVAEAWGVALVAAADSARDPRRSTNSAPVK